ncbi:unnamed protein product [Prorocentrum cordatum]|nr:unnamed protein product [Polarella glacialis]
MSPEMVGAAKKVTQEAEQAAKEIESVNTSKAEKMKLVGHAITSLQSLQGTWEKAAKDALANEKAAEDKETSAAARIAVLKEKLEQKKAMLAKDETMLKEAQVQKQLLERAEQAEGGSREEARQQLLRACGGRVELGQELLRLLLDRVPGRLIVHALGLFLRKMAAIAARRRAPRARPDWARPAESRTFC